MEKETTNLFPDKELFDMKFLGFIKFDKAEVSNRSEIDKAMQEYFCLVKKAQEVDKLLWKHTDDLVKKYDSLKASIDYVANIISDKIENYCNAHTGDFNFKKDGDDKSRATLTFEHGEIIITRKERIDFKFKPVKEYAKA